MLHTRRRTDSICDQPDKQKKMISKRVYTDEITTLVTTKRKQDVHRPRTITQSNADEDIPHCSPQSIILSSSFFLVKPRHTRACTCICTCACCTPINKMLEGLTPIAADGTSHACWHVLRCITANAFYKVLDLVEML